MKKIWDKFGKFKEIYKIWIYLSHKALRFLFTSGEMTSLWRHRYEYLNYDNYQYEY